MRIFRRNFALRVYFENGYSHHIVVMARSHNSAVFMGFRAFPLATAVNARIIE